MKKSILKSLTVQSTLLGALLLAPAAFADSSAATPTIAPAATPAATATPKKKKRHSPKVVGTTTPSMSTPSGTPSSTPATTPATTVPTVSTPSSVATKAPTASPTPLASASPSASPMISPTAETSAQAAPASAGKPTVFSVDLGGDYDAWDSNVEPLFDGSEFWVPLSLRLMPVQDLSFYVQSAFAQGTYNNTPTNYSLSDLSDTQIGGELDFKTIGMDSAFLLSFNVPTGDPTWETKETGSIIPTQFIDTRYQGRGFGVNALLAFSAPVYDGSVGLGLGYLYSGAFNPYYGDAASESVNLGDSLFASLNRVWVHSNDEHDVVQASFYYFLPSNLGGPQEQVGPNFSLSYDWKNPQGFSWGFGGQYFFPGWDIQPGGASTPMAHNLFAPRFFLDASYNLGGFILSANGKYVLANDYPVNDPSGDHDGGGFLVGGGPSLLIHFSDDVTWKLSGSYDYVDDQSVPLLGGRAEVKLNQWGVGSDFEINFE